MKNICLIAIALLIANHGFSQKLLETEHGLRAPYHIKIDGKLTEWGKLTTYNRATQVFYTIANDNENLYVVVKATLPEIIDKIVKGGITITVNQTVKKKLSTDPAVTYPLFSTAGAKLSLMLKNKPEPTGDPVKDKAQLDSFVRIKNVQIDQFFKRIGTRNLKDIADTEISVYNDNGIKAACRLDDNLCLNYELAIPIRSLGFSGLSGRFYYNIQLNSMLHYNISGDEPILEPAATGANIDHTDFWGEYTLGQ